MEEIQLVEAEKRQVGKMGEIKKVSVWEITNNQVTEARNTKRQLSNQKSFYD